MMRRFTSKAVIEATQTDVCFVPKADITSLDHLVGAGDEVGCNGQTKRLRCL
jgi:hypothetical protein